MRTPVHAPDLVRVQTADGWREPGASGVCVECSEVGDDLRVAVSALDGVSRIALRWNTSIAAGTVVLGDAWERSYGDLGFRSLKAERPLPWIFLTHDPESGASVGVGVEVRGSAFACWTIDPDGVTLWLDVRAGGNPVELGSRTLTAAVVRAVRGLDPFATHRELCGALCADPLPVEPLVGANNWYYAYGKDFDANAVVRDARTIADLAGDHPVRPFGVVDDGWTPDGTADGLASSGGPWDAGRPVEFPDMAGVAAAIAAEGVRPGIWFRPLLSRVEPVKGLRAPRDGGFALDPSDPAVLDLVGEDVSRIVGWGFELLKHDFSSYDLLGRWGPEMGASVTEDGWSQADPTITTAESLVGFYERFHAAAGDAVVLGCNVVGHLAAGLVHAQRTGDDTSGRQWDRTRRVGVNTLGFRMAQHGTFFALDADCVASTPQTPWEQNRQFLDLIARSGTALFVSVDPATRDDRVDADLSSALRLALDGGVPGGVEPLDWLTNPTPARWQGADATHEYSWTTELGADPYEWGRFNQ